MARITTGTMKDIGRDQGMPPCKAKGTEWQQGKGHWLRQQYGGSACLHESGVREVVGLVGHGLRDAGKGLRPEQQPALHDARDDLGRLLVHAHLLEAGQEAAWAAGRSSLATSRHCSKQGRAIATAPCLIHKFQSLKTGWPAQKSICQPRKRLDLWI